MNIIVKNSKIQLIEKKSRFIAHSFIVSSEYAATTILKDCSLCFLDATHNVYAYRILDNNVLKVRFSDANEPKHTAGKPIVDLLSRLDLVNILVVVFRYFGGIKLGIPGLLRAYLNSAKCVINASKIDIYIPKYLVEIFFDYNQIAEVNKLLQMRKHTCILEKSFSTEVIYKICADKETLELLSSRHEIKLQKIGR